MQSDFEILDNVTAFLSGMPYKLDYITGSIFLRFDQMQVDFCKCLRIAGARYVEIKDRNKIIEVTQTHVRIQAAKGGNIYEVEKAGFPASFFMYYNSGLEMYPTCRLQSFTRHIYAAMYPYRFYAGGRNLIKHMFRYRHVIALHRFGMSDEDISLTIGEVDVKNTRGYWKNEIVIKHE